MNVIFEVRSAMKTKCENRDVRYHKLPDVVMVGTFVKTQRQMKESVRGARHATKVFSLWLKSK